MYIYIYIIFTNPSAQAGYDKRSILSKVIEMDRPKLHKNKINNIKLVGWLVIWCFRVYQLLWVILIPNPVFIYIFNNPSARTGYDTRSV